MNLHDIFIASKLIGGGSGSGGDTPSGGEEWIGDGNTHIWISLSEGRTSPVVGLAVNGTVTVDWGDGAAPDVLTGTDAGIYSTIYTPKHEYSKAGDYVITLIVDGEATITGNGNFSSNLLGTSHYSYPNSIRKLETGNGILIGTSYALCHCCSLESVKIADGVKSIGANTFTGCSSLKSVVLADSITTFGGNSPFQECYSLTSVNIPNRVSQIVSYAFNKCYSLTSISIPDSVQLISNNAFDSCCSLMSVVIPNSVTTIEGGTFTNCYSLKSATIPNSITSMGTSIFYNCRGLKSIILQNGITTITQGMFGNCRALPSVTIPKSVTTIDTGAFSGCKSVSFYDFTEHTAVPSLAGTNAFTGIPSDCEIRVPAALVNEWKAATNWSTYADKIVGV